VKKIAKIIFTCLFVCIGVIVIVIVGLIIFGKGKITLPVEKKEMFEIDHKARYAKSLCVKGNKILNENGEQILLKGVVVPEAKKLDFEHKFKKEYFDQIFSCGGNVIRIPVHPNEWAEDEDYLWRYLDPLVTWAIEKKKYVIIDLHFIGNIETGDGTEMVDVGMKPYDFSVEFWKRVASYFKNVPNIIFEIYNEPALISGETWKKYANSLVATVRKTGANQLILVSGIDYSYDLSCWENEPLKDSNIAYTAHVFPNRIGWEQKLESIAATLPIIVTEWGYAAENGLVKQTYLVGNRENYGEPFLQFMGKYNIGWTACWYDDSWEPPMFLKGMKKKTDWGLFVLEHLK
jgi:Endoglucanase